MGQRLNSPPVTSQENFFESSRHIDLTLAIFHTDLGWFGLLGHDGVAHRLTIGHIAADEVRRSFVSECADDAQEIDFNEGDWNVPLRRRLQKFTQGFPDDFRDVEIALPKSTDFQRRIFTATRGIRYGKTLSYADVAAKAGSPRAARAVGNAMASNRFPIIIPCHRVIASGGKYGGFSAPQGVDLKKRMLMLEAEA